MAQIRMRNVRKSSGGTEAIKGIDLDIDRHEFVVLAGPPGCGKSTLLRMIAGLEVIAPGDLWIGGVHANEMSPQERGLATTSLVDAIDPRLLVGSGTGLVSRKAEILGTENAVTALEPLAALEPDRAARPQVSEYFAEVELAEASDKIADRQPPLIVVDEALGETSASWRRQTHLELARLHTHLRATIIYATDEPCEVMSLADRIIVMRDGRIEQAGTPRELYETPSTLFVANFVGSPRMNVLPLADLVGREFADGHGSKLVGFRPDAISIAPEGPIQGQVKTLERVGRDTLVHVDVAGTMITLHSPDEKPARIGQNVWLAFSRSKLHLFDPEGRALGQRTS